MTSSSSQDQVFLSLQPFIEPNSPSDLAKKWIQRLGFESKLEVTGSMKYGGLHPNSDVDFIFHGKQNSFARMLNSVFNSIYTRGLGCRVTIPCLNLVQVHINYGIKLDFTMKHASDLAPIPLHSDVAPGTHYFIQTFNADLEAQTKPIIHVDDMGSRFVKDLQRRVYLLPGAEDNDFKQPFFTLVSVLKMMYPDVPTMVFYLGIDLAMFTFDPEVHEDKWDFAYFILVKFMEVCVIRENEDSAFFYGVWQPYFNEHMNRHAFSIKNIFHGEKPRETSIVNKRKAKHYILSEAQYDRLMNSKFVLGIQTLINPLPAYAPTMEIPRIACSVLRFATAFVIIANNYAPDQVKHALRADPIEFVCGNPSLYNDALRTWLQSEDEGENIPMEALDFLTENHYK
jgi:hypothetical protein